VYASSQNPTETQAIVAEVLGIAFNEVEVEVRRIGGGFGGKETQGNHVAAWAALLSGATRQPVKIHLFRDDDQLMTGKRHPFHSFYEAGFDDDGRLLAYSIILNADAGYATDLSRAILERAMLHAENAYYIPDVRIVGRLWKTNNPSNTAFRGFGGPQGMAVIEQVIDRVARYLGKDAAEIREMNFYAEGTRNITPYGAVITQHRIKDAFSRLMQTSGYRERRREVDAYNREHEFTKKGLSSTPVKFGISFTTSFLNQAGALVNIYTDGTIQVNHGGTEMGQGLHAKILHVAAAELGISPKFIRITNTNTSKVPNTSPTAASSGSDLNGMAVKQAVTVLKERLAEVAAGEFNRRMPDSGCKAEQVIFANNLVSIHGKEGCSISFHELAALARMKQVSLSATGYYKTPGIWFDRDKGKGDPFYYYAYGVSVSEVIVNTLTGQHMVLRTDILQDAGDSLNEGIDTGQVEGGFVQGLGWCTTEEMKWNSEGFQLTHSPDTYKIPTVNDIPEDFRVNLMKNVPNDGTIRGSKAVGEPPFMLAFSVWLAIKDAISAVGDHRIEPEFSLPATAEVILLSAEKIRKAVKAGG
jgi:xanthine dehydrogenase molybdopterin binding subunit